MAYSNSSRADHMRRNRANKGGKASAASPTHKYPLQTIVGTATDPVFKTISLDVLACGHTISRATDLFGEVNRYRRRCKKCFESKPKDISTEDLHGK